MSNKFFLKIVVAFGLLALLLTILGVNFVPRISALSSAGKNTMNTVIYAGSDYIERHPSAIASSIYYLGSDWIERHPSVVASSMSYAGSDWIERHPSNYYDNSDWIERHSGQSNP